MQIKIGLILFVFGLLLSACQVFWSDLTVGHLILAHPFAFITDFLMVVMGIMMVVIGADKQVSG